MARSMVARLTCGDLEGASVRRALTLLEVASVVAAAVGVFLLFSLGAALLFGGVVGVVACEWTLSRREGVA